MATSRPDGDKCRRRYEHKRWFFLALEKRALQYSLPSMVELTPQQMKVIERLVEGGFRPIAIPPYESALCMRKGECVAVLAPVANGGLKLLAPVSYLVDGNISVRLKRGEDEVFVWKKRELPATPERLEELEKFRSEITGILETPAIQ
jgi:hypothetical protein